MGADMLELRVAVAWAALELDAGDPTEARAILAPALARMHEGAGTADVRNGRELLASLERSSAP
jgi:hypothetical protein